MYDAGRTLRETEQVQAAELDRLEHRWHPGAACGPRRRHTFTDLCLGYRKCRIGRSSTNSALSVPETKIYERVHILVYLGT
jgi:hypothetical protein